MALNYHQEGDVLDYTNTTGAAIASGDPVAIGNIIGIALVDIAISAVGSVALEGVWKVAKATGNAWVQGAKVIWDKSAAKFDHGGATPATGDISNCCVAAYAAASGDTVGYVKINVGMGTVT
jgi:predicted RecA/RadA family phage recombinase